MELSFKDLHLSEEVLRAIEEMGFEEPSPIQAQTIPLMLEGVDLIGQAQTGTGKTAAFGIPIIERVLLKDEAVQALVLCPTRELCIQVAEEISRLAKFKRNVRVLPIYGGQPIERQIRTLKKGVQIVVGTPGRVIDHIERRTLKLGGVKTFVLDEADEMFDMGFREDIELVIGHLPETVQKTFYSATMAREIMDFATKYQDDPKIIRVVKKEMTVPKVDQFYYDLDSHMKPEILTRVLDIYNPNLTIVFCNTKKMVDELTEGLVDKGYFAEALHGDLKQTQRDQVMNKFRKSKVDVLVATDVAARGIDVDEVDMVINYDMPQDDEYYVHRIGRTARAGREGTAISFVSGREYYKLRDIQKYTKTKILRKELPTIHEIRRTQDIKHLDMLRDAIEKGEAKKLEHLVNVLLEEDRSPVDIASAALWLYAKEKGIGKHQELDYVDNDKVRPPRDNRRKLPFDKGGKWGYARIFLSVGRLDGISERHVLSAILNSTHAQKAEVGKIDIYDKYSFVEVKERVSKDAVQALNKSKIKGIEVSAELAKPRMAKPKKRWHSEPRRG
ncbi:MAG: DEAD/DEAH box helicase [Tissierellia bacterium]|nr:DEAD/DEAH box helicase [Tissierellia bacterium]